MKAIWISDSHLHWWPTYNEQGKRLQSQKDVLTRIFKTAYTKGVPIFFGGDLFHTPASLTNRLMSVIQPFLIELFNIYPVDFYAISGNHDQSEINTFKRRSPNYINTFANSIKTFHNLDFDYVELDDFVVFGIPYITLNEGYDEYLVSLKKVKGKKNILLNHTDYVGQTDTNGVIVGKGDNIDEDELAKWDLVFSGHVHHAQNLRNNLYIIGAQQQQRLSDMGGAFGYWTLGDNFKPKFREITDTPKFRFYKKESDKDNSFDLWVKEPKTVEELEEQLDLKIDPQDRAAVLNKYLEFTGIKSKRKKAFIRKLIHKLDD